MHFNCKLIPSSSLSHKELEYILTPDEFVRLLSRGKNSQSIINQLPVQLRQSLSISVSKSVQSLLFSLNQKLIKAEWIAVSTTVRKTGVSDTQLAQYPQLKKQIDRVETTQPAKFVKANFKPVTDDVPLVRNLSFTPVEPSPEHKISIEFAGQWPNNAASLLLAKSGEQKEKIAKPRADIHASHRSIATFKDLEPELRNLYLTIPMNGTPQPLKLLLAENIQPVDKETEMDEWDTVLVPVVPMKKLGEEYSLHQTGYFYVIWNGKVWREITIDSNGYFCDLDIQHERQEPLSTRHVNINASEFFPEANMSFEKFELYQEGQKVFSGELDVCEQSRVFNLVAEEVELKFVDFEHDEILLTTFESPIKNNASNERQAMSYPMPHVWLPYKLLGEVQADCYVYYSQASLSDSEISSLEANYVNIAVSIDEMSVYSQQQAFEGEHIYALPLAKSSSFGSHIINEQNDSNIAAITVMPPKNQITLRYRICRTTDQPDDFMMLRNEDQEWSQKVYFRQAKADDEGFLNLPFSGWPKEVEEVDIIRGASADLGTTEYELSVLKTKIKISELIG
ncbi:hypothetical protein [Aliivibrio fischeri]|uniref:hypothetical protein n=1 Tax=Aliivibrio fischeri TaxID=668 RepID=UPI0012DAD2FB|nr:hypothetical protein [Aliivibrio fischeri]MUK64475.1 hypothetical protein [Aliivibrio fischeri]